MSKVSLIITMYNSAQSIAKCLDSILQQSFQNIEAIIVDIGSTDNSLDICKKYTLKDERIKLIPQHNSNLAIANNIGLQLATGDYLMFVNSDDYLTENAVEKSLSIIEKTNSDIAIFEWYEHTKKGLLQVPIPCKIHNSTLAIVEDILADRQPAYIWNKLYAASLWKGQSFNYYEKEADLIKKIFTKASKVFYLPAPLCVHNKIQKTEFKQPPKKVNLLTAISLRLNAILK